MTHETRVGASTPTHGARRKRVDVLISQKGGVGKSTLAMNLAAVQNDVLITDGAGADESPVLVASIDPQGSAVWWADRAEELPFRVAHIAEPSQLRRLPAIPGVERIYIDTPGWHGHQPGTADTNEADGALDAALAIADFAIVPMPPEPLSLQPTASTIERILAPRGIPFCVVINNWDPRDGDSDLEQTKAFIRAKGWPLANTVVRRYRLHTRAAATGTVCTEYHGRSAAAARQDIQKLAHEMDMF